MRAERQAQINYWLNKFSWQKKKNMELRSNHQRIFLSDAYHPYMLGNKHPIDRQRVLLPSDWIAICIPGHGVYYGEADVVENFVKSRCINHRNFSYDEFVIQVKETFVCVQELLLEFYENCAVPIKKLKEPLNSNKKKARPLRKIKNVIT